MRIVQRQLRAVLAPTAAFSRSLALALAATAFGLSSAGVTFALDLRLETPGASEELRAELANSAQVLTAQARGLERAQDILAAARADYRNLIGVLYDAGHYGPDIRIRVDGREAATIPLLETPARIDTVVITVTPGPLFRFGTAQIGPLADGTKLPDSFRTGAPAPTGAMRDAASAGVERWRGIGHAKAGIAAQKITADHRNALLNARIRLDPGPELRFGQLRIRGNQAVRSDAIARIAGFPTGSRFSPEAARLSAQRLRRTGAFSSVTLREAKTANPDDTLDFALSVVEAPPRRIRLGAELSSRRGLDLSLAWMHRNLLGGAERLRLEGALRNIGGTTDIDGTLLARLDRPAYFGADNDLFYQLELTRQEETHYRLSHLTAGVGWRRTYSPERFAELSVMVGYHIADDAYGQDRVFRQISLPGRFEWDKRDDPGDAKEGFYLNAVLVPFAGLSGSSSGLHGRLDARAYLGLGAEDRFVLAARVQLGTVLGASQAGTSPDLLFFSGGAQTVRGQPHHSLGVPVGTNLAGGRSFLGLSAELRAQVSEKLSVVGFYDYGKIGADPLTRLSDPDHAGAGLGLRYKVPGVGALRLDLAYPVSGDKSEGLQFYVGVGQAF